MTPRVATAADVPRLAALINRAYRVEEFFVRGERTSEADVLRRLSRPGTAFLVLDDGEALIGAIFVDIMNGRGYFAMLAVDPDRQGQGLGRTMVTAAESFCRERGCKHMDLDVVNLRQELPAFYDRLGYAPHGMAPFQEPSKLKRPAHLVKMTKPLAVMLGLAVLAACRNAPAPPPAPVPAPVAEASAAAPEPGTTWDPWNDAKSRGIEFRAVGNEPGWYLELDNEKWLRLLYAYGERVATVPVPVRQQSGGTTILESSGDGHTLRVEITSGPCSDGMSDQSYPLSVTATIDGTRLAGCGRWLSE